MIKQIIGNLPEGFPEWAIQNTIRGYDLPSHSDVQINWNIAVAKAAQAEAERVYFRSSSGNHIAAWNVLKKAEKYINSQQTVNFNEGEKVAKEVIENFCDALALDPELEWPEGFVPVYRIRAFWSDQKAEDLDGTGSLHRKAGDPRWWVTIKQNTCPYYFLLGTCSHRRVKLETKHLENRQDAKQPWGYEYTVSSSSHDSQEKHIIGGEVVYLPNREEPLWHIPRVLTNQYMPYGIRQGDKIFKGRQRPISFNLGCEWPDIRHKPDDLPYGTVRFSDEACQIHVFLEPPIIRHPEHPPIQVDSRYVEIVNVPGHNIYLGRSSPGHD